MGVPKLPPIRGMASELAGWVVVGPHRMASGMIALIVADQDGWRHSSSNMERRAVFYDRELGGLVWLPFSGTIRPP